MCIVYRFRKKQKRLDPKWKLTDSLPRSRSGSRTTLRNLNSDGSENDTLKKSRSYDKVYRTHEPLEGKPNVEFPEKKWDLDEEDITSSEGSEFPQGKLAKDIDYINPNNPQRQSGRRQQRANNNNNNNLNQQQPIQEESYLPPPVESPSSYSPTFSGLDRNSFPEPPPPPHQQPQNNRLPQGAVRVLPTANNNNNVRYFSDGPASPESLGSPILTQSVGLPNSPGGLPSSPKNTKSTEV